MSDLFKLNWNDLLKGFIVAVVTAILAGVYQIVQTGALPTMEQLKIVGITALTAGIAYLLKNVFTNSNGNILGSGTK